MPRRRLWLEDIAAAWRSGVTRWLLLIVAFVACVGWAFAIRPLAAEWGTVGEWVAGVATAGGLLFTGIQIRDSARERAKEDARQVTVEAERREAQARAVAVWSVASPTADPKKWLIKYKVLNGGDYPVDNAMLLVAGGVGHFDPIAQSGTSMELVMGTLIPGTSSEDEIEVSLRDAPPFVALNSLTVLIFTDTWGQHWARGPSLFERRPFVARNC